MGNVLSDVDVKTAIGDFCDGRELPLLESAVVRAALAGPVETSDRGTRLYYADIDTAALDNVDTGECIWSTGSDGIGRGLNDMALFDLARDEDTVANEVFPLTAISDPSRLSRLDERWASLDDGERRAKWQAFRRRIADPLRKLLDGT